MIIYRGVFDRQDSLRSDYLSDRETRYGIVQQASIDSTDSRLCYLTSSEVSAKNFFTTFSTPNPPQKWRQIQFETRSDSKITFSQYTIESNRNEI